MAHLASYLYNEYPVFPGLKRPGRGADHPHPSSAEVKERVQLYLYSSFWTFVACSRADSILFFTPSQNSNNIFPVISGIKDRRTSLHVLRLQSRRVKNGWSVKLTINLLILLTVGWPKCTGLMGENTRVFYKQRKREREKGI